VVLKLHTQRFSRYILVGVALFVVAVAAILVVRGRATRTQRPEVGATTADYRIKEVHLQEESRDGMRWQLDADQAEAYEQQGKTTLRKVTIRIQEPQRSWTVTGDEGELAHETKSVELRGNVVLISSDGLRLETNRLRWDAAQQRCLIARDPIGVCPLYQGRDAQGRLWIASEMKALVGACEQIAVFPPGHYLDSEVGEVRRYYEPAWREYEAVRNRACDVGALRDALERAVERQLMCDVPYAVLLSGGLDSSVISALAQRHSKNRIEDGGLTPAWWPQLHSFAIGLEGSPDLAAARDAARAIGTIHHELPLTVQEGIDALSDVIYHIESYDVTTVRASTPMYLLARRIKSVGIKMVFTGEGSDEVFGGYLYFHKAPNAAEFHAETVRKLDQLHKYDCLRANKSMAAWGIEARVPFLDREFLDVAMSVDSAEKMVTAQRPIEKWVLRKAFEELLPGSIIWRQKEQFSDGVGYSWIDSLKALAEREVTDDELARAHYRFPVNPPQTKEAYFYRAIFDRHFPGDAPARCVPGGPSVACSTPAAVAWDAAFSQLADPSGRAVRGVHKESY